MEPEDSFPCSQESSADPYPEPDQSGPYHPIRLKIINPPTSWSSWWSVYIRLSM
jgi:hypothetical protein